MELHYKEHGDRNAASVMLFWHGGGVSGQAKSKILVTVGEKEKALMKKSARDIVRANPNCTGIVIPKVGHGAPLAQPLFFNRIVDGWIHTGNPPKECKLI